MDKRRIEIYLPVDTGFTQLLEQAAGILRAKGYVVSKYPKRDSYTASALFLSALQFVIDQGEYKEWNPDDANNDGTGDHETGGTTTS